jgi:hypothetical protein
LKVTGTQTPKVLTAEGRIVLVDFDTKTVHPTTDTGSADTVIIGALTPEGAVNVGGRVYRFIDIAGKRPDVAVRAGRLIALIGAEPRQEPAAQNVSIRSPERALEPAGG